MPRRVWVALGLVLGLGAIVAASIVASGGPGGAAVHVHVARRGPLRAEVSATGEVEARKAIKVGAEVAGRINEVLVEAGRAVRAGEPLVRIDEETVAPEVERLEAEVRVQRMAIEAAELALEQARSEAARVVALGEREVASQGELEAARVKVRAGEVEVAQARERMRQSAAVLRQARENLARTTIASPMDGVVTVVHLREGEGVIPGLTNTAGTVILEVADLTEVWARVDVGEAEVPRVAVGQAARVELDAFPGREFRAEVREVALQGEASAGDVSRFAVRMALAEPDPGIRPGMSVRARITTDTREDAVAVPIQAVVRRPRAGGGEGAAAGVAGGGPKDLGGGRPTGAPDTEDVAFVEVEGKAVRRAVTLGISSDSDVEVTRGIEPGDRVITGPYRALKELEDGDPVEGSEEAPADNGAAADGEGDGDPDRSAR